jgi:hypothetical protein
MDTRDPAPADPPFEALEALAAGELSAAEARAWEARIQGDGRLQDAYARVQQVEAMLRRETLLPVPLALLQETLARVLPLERVRPWRVVGRVAAAVLVFCGSWFAFSGEAPALAAVGPQPQLAAPLAAAPVTDLAAAAPAVLTSGDPGAAATLALGLAGVLLIGLGLFAARRWHGRAALSVLGALVFLAAPAEAAPIVAATGEQVQNALMVLIVVVLGLVGAVGLGAVALLLRAILPGVGRAADASLARIGAKRLWLTGVLPLVGAGLLGRAVHSAQSEVAGAVFGVLVVLPLCVALGVGALAALPHLGAQVQRGGAEASPLRCASVGGLVTGLAMVSWLVAPLGVAVTVLLAGWWIGIGLGGLVRRPAAPAAS